MLTEASGFRARVGFGVEAVVEGREVLVGTRALMVEKGIDVAVADAEAAALAAGGKTPVYVGIEGALAGVLGVADTVKPGSRAAVAALRGMGLRVGMVTGDHRLVAEAIGREVGIGEEMVFAPVLPQEKAAYVTRWQGEGLVVGMVGDGINDAPALAQADVGMAMGNGTDVAMDAAGITLVGGDLGAVAEAIALSRRTMRTIRQNLFWALVYNVVGIPVAAGVLQPWTGWMLSPMIASAAMALSSVSVVGNSLRLRHGGGTWRG